MSAMMKVVLASASPRRRELLKQLDVATEIVPADFDEAVSLESDAAATVLFNAVGKGREVAARTGTELPVIAADTVVARDGVILGKPADAEEAKEMLRFLSGKVHQVLTGVYVAYGDRELSQVCTTQVYFRKLTEEEIEAYVATGEPLDKAGAYGIQGKGAILVEHIEGDYNNVVGLPLTLVYSMLRELGAWHK